MNATRIEQQQNNEVDVSTKPSVVINQFRKILEAAARDVRYLLNQDICVPDDEDTECIEPDDYCKIPIIPEVDVDYSGSGEPPTIDFTPSENPNATISSTATASSSITIPHATNTPSKPSGPATDPPGPTIPNEWTVAPPKVDDANLTAGASSIHQSLYILLLLTINAILFLW